VGPIRVVNRVGSVDYREIWFGTVHAIENVMATTTKTENQMITKITITERTSDMADNVRELLPVWIESCEEKISDEYPDADIQIRLRNGECGPSEIEVEGEPDDNDMDNISLIVDEAWEAISR
jgi:hypothetical protein